MQKVKKIPQRQCVGCREMKDKKSLLRVVKSPEGVVSLDFVGKKPGRGAYVCHDVECLKKARKSRALERAFSTAIPRRSMTPWKRNWRDTMNRNEQFLSLIGLCLRGRNLEVGEEPVEAVARARDARVLLLASDAADNTARRVQHFAEAGQCVWLRIPFTKQELGQATGRGSAAVAAITDIGLAVAVVRRLAEMDPEKYDEDLAKLELKAKQVPQSGKVKAVQHEKEPGAGNQSVPKNRKCPMRKGPDPQASPVSRPARSSAAAQECPTSAQKRPVPAEPPKTAERQNPLPRMTAPAGPSARAGPALPKATAPNPRGGRIHTPTAAR